jgi:maltoporin
MSWEHNPKLHGLALAAICLLALSGVALCEVNTSGVTFNGMVSLAYTYNFNNPDSQTNLYRVFDFDDNTFKVDAVELVVQKAVTKPGDAGFRVDAVAGSSLPRVEAARGLFFGQDLDVHQAYVSYIFAVAGKGLQVDFGKFVTSTGYEVIEGYDGFNDNYSHSFLFGYAIPFTHTGIRAGYPLSDKLAASVAIVNGWDVVKDNNKSKSVCVHIGYVPTSLVNLNLNVVAGPERDHNDSDHRSVVDFTATVYPVDKLTLGANIDFGHEANAAIDSGDASWAGVAAYFRYNFSEHIAGIVRAEYFDDAGGSRTGVKQNLSEITLTPECHLAKSLIVRPELRLDLSSKSVFSERRDGLKKTQSTAAFNVIYVF